MESDELLENEELVENEEQFWDELDDIVSTPCRTNERIDDTLRTWLSFTASYRESYVQTEQAVLRCSYALLSSSLFAKNDEYIRRQITYCLLQEDEPLSIHFAAALLLLDGRRHEQAFELMNAESAFPRLVQMIRDGVDDDLGLHRHMLELLYEMSRIQKISWTHLTTVDDEFVLYLLQIVESLANDANDPYHYPVIRVLLVLNEQYMLNTDAEASSPSPLTNRVIKTLSTQGRSYKSFGSNIILLLNREAETSLQLLILKLLYLLFNTPSTQEYFYTNDLFVLTDILMRNLLDLPTSAPTAALRHTYLRVLHPLLAHTQLRTPPHYKRDELRRTLSLLAAAGDTASRHFEAPDATTVRLVNRTLSVDWLSDPDDALPPQPPDIHIDAGSSDSDPTPAPTSGAATVARRALGLQIPEAQESTLSVSEVAAQRERPGVLTPSRARPDAPPRPPHGRTELESSTEAAARMVAAVRLEEKEDDARDGEKRPQSGEATGPHNEGHGVAVQEGERRGSHAAPAPPPTRRRARKRGAGSNTAAGEGEGDGVARRSPFEDG